MSAQIAPLVGESLHNTGRDIHDTDSNAIINSTIKSNDTTSSIQNLSTENKLLSSDSDASSTPPVGYTDFNAEAKEAVTAVLSFLHELLQCQPKSSTQQKIENRQIK